MSVLSLLVFFSGHFELPVVVWFPMQLGIILTASFLIYKHRCTRSGWDGFVPRSLKILLPLLFLAGAACIVYAIAAFKADISSAGRAMSRLSAYFANGQCYAVFNREPPIKMLSEFCIGFQSHMAIAFCGGWMTFSAVLTWFSWKFNGPDLEAEYESQFERERERAEW